jgi:SAM-dependent methyltransferase
MSKPFLKLLASSDSPMYSSYAFYYDQFYSKKNYIKEGLFLHKILSDNSVKNILDVGCGTGTHMLSLENQGYVCAGLDLNSEMLNIARKKVKGSLALADMRNFELTEKFDSIICMFAVFNHNLSEEDALSTLINIKNHLKKDGLLIIDLYNPQVSGEKSETIEHISRSMKWELDNENRICNSVVKFTEGDIVNESIFPLKIYSISEIETLLIKAGYSNIFFYDNYTLNPGSIFSKNLIVKAKC